MNWRVVLGGLGILIALKAEGWRLRAERRVQNALTYAEDIIATVQHPLIVLDAELRVQRANRSFYESFGVSEAETVNRFVYELGSGQWNIPRLRELLEDVLLQNHTFNNFEIDRDFPVIGPRSMLLNARRVRKSHTLTKA
jgi:two-component system CheB/CheR fusion protein